MARSSGDQRSSSRSGQQSMMTGLTGTAREHPVATAAAVGGAVAAGAFLWSKRSQIGEQLGNMSEQIGGMTGNGRTSSSTHSAGLSSTPMGVETGSQSGLSGAATSPTMSSTRATGGSTGKAQTGDTLSPARTASTTPGL